MMRINLNDFMRNINNASGCKDITSEVEISPSPCNKEAYAAWKKKREMKKANKLPVKRNK